MRREKLMVVAQEDPALMQKLLAETSAEQIAAAIVRIEWGGSGFGGTSARFARALSSKA
jgi:hypothetical protein